MVRLIFSIDHILWYCVSKIHLTFMRRRGGGGKGGQLAAKACRGCLIERHKPDEIKKRPRVWQRVLKQSGFIICTRHESFFGFERIAPGHPPCNGYSAFATLRLVLRCQGTMPVSIWTTVKSRAVDQNPGSRTLYALRGWTQWVLN